MNSISAISLREHPINACIQDVNGNSKPFPTLVIDGVPLNLWINQNTNIIDRTDNLVPAQGWLYNFENNHSLSNAWKLLEPKSSEYGVVSTVVPLLICPDDLDLICSVIMVEQIVTDSKVQWTRFGLACGNTDDVVTSVIWENPISAPILTFNYIEFEQAYNDLKRLDEIWSQSSI